MTAGGGMNTRIQSHPQPYRGKGVVMRIVQEIRSEIDRCGRPIAEDAELVHRAGQLLLSLRAPRTPPEGEEWRCDDEGVTELPRGPDPRFKTLNLAEDERFYLVGDLHGDFEATASILRAIFKRDMPDKQAEKVRLVFLGDLIDRGELDFQVVELVVALQKLLGDAVIQMRGNHEQWRAIDSNVESSVAESGRTFLGEYRHRLSLSFLTTLACHFASLPHVVIISHPRGRIGLMHAGIPPNFLLEKYPQEQWMQVPNIRGALLWGRPEAGNRPSRYYPYDTFYDTDVEDFCRRLDLRLVIRGHDVQENGYALAARGRLLTVSSSGRNTRVGAPDGPYPDVRLPRYVELVGAVLFDSGQRDTDAGLPAGIFIRETFGRDIVVLVPGEDAVSLECDCVVRDIHEKLQESQRQAFRIARREQYSAKRTPPHAVLSPQQGDYDPALDARAENPSTFELARAGSIWRFRRWLPPESRSKPAMRTIVEYDDLQGPRSGSAYDEFVRACAELVADCTE